MTRYLVISVIATGIVALGLGGCAPGNDRENGTLMSTRTGDERALATPEQAVIGVRKLLYEQNLIRDPEVNRKMKEAVLRITRDGAPSDSVMPDLYRWLEDWTATHPAEIEAARLAGGGYTAEARRVYVDTDSSRKAQTDSIRRLVRERARRRIEDAHASVDSTTGV
jgi:hypothetical protein